MNIRTGNLRRKRREHNALSYWQVVPSRHQRLATARYARQVAQAGGRVVYINVEPSALPEAMRLRVESMVGGRPITYVRRPDLYA
jgi:hypothetical protein